MFDEFNTPILHIESTWSRVFKRIDGGCQTKIIEKSHVSCQSVEKNEKYQQCDDVEKSIILHDLTSLEVFLRKVESLMSKELLMNIRSKVKFPGITSSRSLKEIFRLQGNSGSISDICFNQKNSIAISFSQEADMEHMREVCNHKGQIMVWNLSIRNRVNGKVPSQILELNSCVTTIDFHPNDPMILCAGQRNGEIIVWDMSNESTTTSRIINAKNAKDNEQSYHECVCTVKWLCSLNQIISLGREGKIILWSYNSDKRISPLKGITLMQSDINKLLSRTLPCPGRIMNILEDKGFWTIIIGTEGGSLVSIDLDSLGKFNVVSPISTRNVFVYNHESGVVNDIAATSTEKLKFFTASSNGSICLWKVNEKQPQTIFFPTAGLYPVPSLNSFGVNELICITEEDVVFYKLASKKHSIVPQQKMAKLLGKCSILRINKRSNIVAIGNSEGLISIRELDDQ
jgi:WD40 repeat protein